MRELTVSVVIPVLDDAEALGCCLRRLRIQTMAPLEVVVVDNGCTDNSVEVAQQYGARVVREPTRGIPAAAATGYDAARGDILARCDADSSPPRDWVARIEGAFRSDAGLDAVTGGGYFYGMPAWQSRVLGPAYLGSYYLLVHLALGHTPLWGSNMALRRSAWQNVRSLVERGDPELHDDIDVSFALGPRCRVAYLRGCRVGVSARSLRGGEQLRRRMRRALRTLERNWGVLPPWLRWRIRIEQALAGRQHRPHDA